MGEQVRSSGQAAFQITIPTHFNRGHQFDWVVILESFNQHLSRDGNRLALPTMVFVQLLLKGQPRPARDGSSTTDKPGPPSTVA